MIITGLEMRNYGLGCDGGSITPAQLTTFKQLLYAAQICWHVGTSMLRFSALAFYFRIFHVRSNPSRIWTKLYWATLAVSIAWLVGVFLQDAIFICNPIHKFWTDPELEYCIPQFNLLIAGTTGSVVTDTLVVLLPLPQVLKLNMKWRRKLAVSLTFLLGYAYAKHHRAIPYLLY